MRERGDVEKQGCRRREMHKRRDAGEEEDRKGRMQESGFAGKEIFRNGGMEEGRMQKEGQQELRDSEAACRGGKHERNKCPNRFESEH